MEGKLIRMSGALQMRRQRVRIPPLSPAGFTVTGYNTSFFLMDWLQGKTCSAVG